MKSRERVARLAIREAGQSVASIFRTGRDTGRADESSGEIIRSILTAEFPEDFAMGDNTWWIEPLSGKENLQAGIPLFALSLALECRSQISFALIFDPLRNELFEASPEVGVLLNAGEVAISKRGGNESIVSVTGKKPNWQPKAWRSLGSWALENAYLAAGRLDAISYNNGLDLDSRKGCEYIASSAGAVIVEENGIQIMTPSFLQDI